MHISSVKVLDGLGWNERLLKNPQSAPFLKPDSVYGVSKSLYEIYVSSLPRRLVNSRLVVLRCGLVGESESLGFVMQDELSPIYCGFPVTSPLALASEIVGLSTFVGEDHFEIRSSVHGLVTPEVYISMRSGGRVNLEAQSRRGRALRRIWEWYFSRKAIYRGEF